MASAADDFEIRRITPDGGPVLRELRMSSLADAPDAFGQTIGQIRERPDSQWCMTARQSAKGASHCWLLAFVDGAAVGLVQGRRRPMTTLLVFSMWIDPAYRRGGIATALIDAIERWAAGWDARQTVLWVLERNTDALEFYRRLGFVVLEDGEDAANGSRFEAVAMRRTIERLGYT